MAENGQNLGDGEQSGGSSRRDFLASLAAGIGVVLSYGLLTAQGLLFLIPERLGAKKRKIFVGNLNQFLPGKVQTFTDPFGSEMMIKRVGEGVRAFSSTCPHLGCKVHWIAEKKEFFCPCHSGVFDADGVATAGPPADAKQRLEEVALQIDKKSGVVYVEVPDRKHS